MSLDRVATVADLRAQARRTLPRPIFDFLEGAAFQELTTRANCDDFDKLRFYLRPFRDVAQKSAATTLLGHDAAFPAAISPIGLGGVMWGGGGEVQGALAAKAAGIPYTLGMLSIATIEEVAEAAGPFWFQICLLTDRGLVKALLDRAQAAGSDVLVVTVTWAASGLQSRMVRNAMDLPPKITLKSLWDFARKPSWVARHLLGKKVGFNNFEGLMPDPRDLGYIIERLDSSATWRDLEWLRANWNGRIMIKGITHPDDARLAFDHGADAISVSNHGGNQLDSCASTISLLPDVVAAADRRGEVFLDGGVRSGQDVLKAVALGARGCLLGRAYLYGLAAAGQAGVAKALALMQYEVEASLALCGLPAVDQVDSGILFRGG